MIFFGDAATHVIIRNIINYLGICTGIQMIEWMNECIISFSWNVLNKNNFCCQAFVFCSTYISKMCLTEFN